jgi:DNA-binding HxlR family transcriptional regulator
MTEDIEKFISEVTAKDSHELCREVMSITDTMDVLRSKWTVEVLTAIVCGNTRFKDIQEAVHGVSEKVLTERLRQMQEDKLIERHECYGYPPRVEYLVTEHGKLLFVIAYQMTEWGQEHRRLILDLPAGK